MLSASVPMKEASQILGHSTAGITADLYQHVISEMKLEAADKVGNAVFNQNKDTK